MCCIMMMKCVNLTFLDQMAKNTHNTRHVLQNNEKQKGVNRKKIYITKVCQPVVNPMCKHKDW